MFTPKDKQWGRASRSVQRGEHRPRRPVSTGLSSQEGEPEKFHTGKARFSISSRWPRSRGMFISHTHRASREEIAVLLARLGDTALARRQKLTEDRLSQIEVYLEHAVRPVLTRFAREIEWSGEPDAIPAAASVQYEWMEGVDKVLRIVDAMMAEFNDPPTRLSYHVKTIDRLAALLKVARSHGNRNLTFAVLTVHDAMYSVYSEDMTNEQAVTVRDAVARLQNMVWDRDTLRALDRFLRNAGFETVPSDKFLSSHVAPRSS